MIKKFIVDSTCNNMRFDRWLRNKLGKIPQGLIEKKLRVHTKLKPMTKLIFLILSLKKELI